MNGSNKFALALMVAGLIVWVGCEKKSTPAPATTGNGTTAKGDGHDHEHAEGDHTHAPTAGHHGAVIELGSTAIGPFTVKASRDEGQLVAGGDAPIDAWLTPAANGDAQPAKVVAVRFWIGTQSGEESIKAKADIENPGEPNHWHTHAEVPSPIPAGAKLWVEIELEGQGKQAGSFDLKL